MKNYPGFGIKIGFEAQHLKRAWWFYHGCSEFKDYNLHIMLAGFYMELNWGIRDLG